MCREWAVATQTSKSCFALKSYTNASWRIFRCQKAGSKTILALSFHILYINFYLTLPLNVITSIILAEFYFPVKNSYFLQILLLYILILIIARDVVLYQVYKYTKKKVIFLTYISRFLSQINV